MGTKIKEKPIQDLERAIAAVRMYSGVCVPGKYEPVGALLVDNGCCPGKPVLLTRMRDRDKSLPVVHATYSCQCVCGRYGTHEYPDPEGAIEEYREFSRWALFRRDGYEHTPYGEEFEMEEPTSE